MSTVRIGIVGLGWWACDVHIPNFLQVPGAQIAALCSRNPENIQRGRDALKGKADPVAFSSYDQLLASDAVDAVVLCTPNATHGALALQALQEGKKHILVEKPIATDPRQCPPIIEEAERQGLICQVGVELRYSDVMQAMRRLIDEGVIGELQLVRSTFWRDWGTPSAWRADDAQAGGLLHELGVHYIDLLDFLAGGAPLWATAAGGSVHGIRDFDHVYATIGYEGGVLGLLAMCLFVGGGGKDIPVEAVGPAGRLLGEVVEGKLTFWPKGGEPEDRSPKRSGAEIYGFPGSLESAAAFVQCVQSGARPSADAEEGTRLCRVCEAARLSAKADGERVTLDSLDNERVSG